MCACSGTGSLRRKEGRERCFHIDDPPNDHTADAIADVLGHEPSSDPIIAIGASQHCLLVARDSGVMLRCDTEYSPGSRFLLTRPALTLI